MKHRSAMVASVLSLAFVFAAAASAGGIGVEISVTPTALWTVSDAGVERLDPRTGAVTARPRPGNPFPLKVAVGGSSVWVCAVENGYTAGSLTRIDMRTGRSKVVLRLANGPVWAVTATGDSAWALTANTSRPVIVRVKRRGGPPVRVSGTQTAVYLAADSGGLWITDSKGWVLRAPLSARTAKRVARLAGGGGSIALTTDSAWIADGNKLVRIDRRTNRVLRRIELPGAVVSLASGADTVWATTFLRERQRLLRVDVATNRITANVAIPSTTTSIATGNGSVWLGVPGPETRIVRLDPHRLTLTRFATLL